MAKQERAIRTRRSVLVAASELFNEVGYEAATIGALLERVDLTRGGLYFHFATKEQLARAVLDEAVTLEGLQPQTFKLQEWVDIALLLAHRVPREPLLQASVRLSVDPLSRGLFGTRWPDWVTVGQELLDAAKAKGELLPHVDTAETSRLLVGAWTGVLLITEVMPDCTLPEEISSLYELILPSIATSGVLARLDTSPYRAERLLAAMDSSTVQGVGAE
ncbi:MULTISPECIES: ScbR family autoregulator-binding transcription factor [unclassified Streptomyces]|uniref:ScbR family autoregulator-binding transcription factor n=1 Tax=unclassified Streptomyces TaxID=2593676 RepID=UPI0033B17641